MGARWIDLVDPSLAELHGLPLRLDAEALEILAAPAGDGRDARPLLDSHGRYLVGVILWPRQSDESTPLQYLELDVVVDRDTIVTVRKSGTHGETVSRDVLDACPADRSAAGWMLHRLMDDTADAYLALVDSLFAEIDELEDAVASLSAPVIRQRIVRLRHEILHARRNASATRAAARRVLDGRLDLGADELFPQPVEAAFGDTYDTLVRTTEELDIARELLSGLRDYEQSRVTEAQNEIVKKLTAAASLVLVPTLITGFFGQNFSGAFEDWWWTLGMSIALIVATTVGQLAFFRWKRWI